MDRERAGGAGRFSAGIGRAWGRTLVAARDRLLSTRFRGAEKIPPADLSRRGVPMPRMPEGVMDPVLYAEAADKVLAGEIRVFDLENAALGRPPRYNRDPKSGIAGPLTTGRELNLDNPALVGDVAYLFEVNRLQHLVRPVQAWLLTGREHYLDGVRELLDAWMEQCPYPLGPNWADSLEVAVRLANLAMIWRMAGGAASPLFRDEPGRAFRDRLLAAVYRHMHFTAGRFAHGPTEGHVLAGQAAGLYLACLTWPCWKQADGWARKARRALVRAAALLVCPDGVGRVQAIGPQLFLFDCLLASALAAEAAGDPLPPEPLRLMEAQLVFLASVMDARDNLPPFGDDLGGRLYRLSPDPDYPEARAALAAGAVLFGRPDFRAKAGALDHHTLWLMGERALAFEEVAGGFELPVRRSFPEGGYTVLGEAFETSDEVRLVADSGPLGFGPDAAQGHADALSFTLSLGGREFLVDPGACAGGAQPEWRDAFRGTAAHNTVRVDGQEQSRPCGPFAWDIHAAARLLAFEPGPAADLWAAEHDGYLRLPDPVVHRREICLFKGRRRLLVTDTFYGRGRHRIERFWHFSEQCRVGLDGDVAVASCEGVKLMLKVRGTGGSRSLVHGRTELPLGFVSRGYGLKVPATVLVCEDEIEGVATLSTEFTW